MLFATETDQYRFVILVLALVILAMLLLLLRYWLLPYLRRRAGVPSMPSPDSSVPLPLRQSIVGYLNRAALNHFELDPALVGVPQMRTFRASTTNQGLKIVAHGIEQRTIHQFLERVFISLQTIAVVHGLRVGDENLSYESEWTIVQPPKFGVPGESIEVIEQIRNKIELFITPFIKELLSIYPIDSNRVESSIDVSKGLLFLRFFPSEGAQAYFGVKDAPNEYTGYINHVLETGAKFIPHARKFSLVQYQKNDGFSTVILKYSFLEDTESAEQDATDNIGNNG